MTRLVRARGTPLWLALYALGLVCVLSFVFFEVLDVDGSDFQTTRSRLSIKLVEGPHEDFKRPALAGAAKALVPVPDLSRPAPPSQRVRSERALHRSPRTTARRFPRLLPRSALPDAPPSA